MRTTASREHPVPTKCFRPSQTGVDALRDGSSGETTALPSTRVSYAVDDKARSHASSRSKRVPAAPVQAFTEKIGHVSGYVTVTRRKVLLGAAATVAAASFSSASNAEEPPWDACRSASKIEYDSARRNHLSQNRFGLYLRTGRLLRRHYWYCHRP